METVEIFALVAAVLFCLAVLRRSTSSPAIQVVGDPAVAQRLVNDAADAFTTRPNDGLLKALATWTGGPERIESITTAAYGSHWRSLRSNLTAAVLNPSRIAALAPLHRDAVQDLVTGLSAGAAGEAVVMREHLDRALFALAARTCFGDGVEESRVRALQRVMEDLTQGMDDNVSLDGSTDPRRLRRLLVVFVPLGELVRPLVAASRARQTAGSYVDSLVDLRVPDGVDGNGKRALGDNEILGLVAEFLATNWKVVETCIEWTLAHLVIGPEVQEKLRREVDEAAADGDAEAWLSEKCLGDLPYLRAVVLESLRMHPPSPFVTRGVHDDLAPGGSIGRLRKKLVFMVRDIGRHGGAWTDPDQFMPERFLPGGEAEDVNHMPGRSEMRMMPFGGGRRFCPGYSLALVRVKFFLAALVRHFELAPPSSGVDLAERLAFNNLMKKPLRVRVTPRTLP